ncbi:MAG: 2-C-methyl-D-erythritol 4-phosphate cytidylyltransferase [Bosea sp.]|jgi:2-C-methyl-D-erythritol 4-phosphate cytidylyltransferase/2-C-methyl-D-erythritol 2,4-cyclodiphosphate synthase|nr:2-C-methyl-D-erythritol 4-phosphate cytidylyltransferase [Bosea sp. (in: a-proteobacteria)]
MALIVAAGRGLRAGGGVPKQYRDLGGCMVLTRTLRAMAGHDAVARVTVAIHLDDAAHYQRAVSALEPALRAKLAPPVHGGATRAETVRRALATFSDADEDALVLIHDGARPFLSPALIDRAVAAAANHHAAVPVLSVTDTVKQVTKAGLIAGTLDRDRLRTIQTPQAFRLCTIRQAHDASAQAGLSDFTDDGAVIEWAGLPLASFAGDPANIKLTHAEDFMLAEARLNAEAPLITRVATGYDVHAFGPGDHVWLGGVKLPHDRGVVAHSDGDVALHALCDAIFGVIGDGDIGVHFPPSDERWRGAPSEQFLAFACARLRARGGVIDHLDVSIVCERPKIGPHRLAMVERIARIAGIPSECVGLKATTSERLGFTGRSEGLAALATVTARLPAAPDQRDAGHG